MTKINYFIIILLSAPAWISCTNIAGKSTGGLNTSSSTIVNTSNSTTYSNVLSQIQVTTGSSGSSTSSGTETIQISQTTGANYQPFTGFCGLGGSNPCDCNLVWTQQDTVNGTSYSYQRTKRVPVTQVQAGLVQCSIDQSVWDEIPEGTVIAMNIVPMTGNNTGLNTAPLNYSTGSTASGVGGDFYDNTLTPFRNIFRYTCFSKNTTARAYEALSQYAPLTSTSSSSSGSSLNIMMGSRYCTGNTSSSGGTSGSTSSCPNSRSGFSAQSYYRNFFVQSDNIVQISQYNDTYQCPQVLESIKYSAGQSIPSSAQGTYWPLDSTFALASSANSVWSVGVPAAVSVYNSGAALSTQTLCNDETDVSKRLKDGKVVVQCLGYAKKPNIDGTCGTIQNNNGQVIPLTRLRRFRVIYPPVFDSTGNVVTGNPFADEVLVADRLVVDNTGTSTGNMIYGPKPCNYAWFDHEGVTKRDGPYNFASNLAGDTYTSGGAPVTGFATPGYRATSDYKYVEDRDHPTDTYNHHRTWSVDPDGLVLPNIDQTGSTTSEYPNGYASCSATLPWVDWSGSTPTDVRLITTHKNRADYVQLGTRNVYLKEIPVQTVDPWIPNYVEDTSFQACVPVPSQYIEAPLHFYKQDNNTMGWCAEVYPTQNPYWYNLNKFIKPQTTSTVPSGQTMVGFSNTITASASPNPVQIYTSHDADPPTSWLANNSSALDSLYNTGCSGTLASTICQMSLAGYGGSAYQSACIQYLSIGRTQGTTFTCDRTVLWSSSMNLNTGGGTQANYGFPLLAPDADINNMIAADLTHNKTFGCTYSVNSDNTKIGTKIPSSGCCGYTGAGQPILQNLLNPPAGRGPSTGIGAHLEPYHDPSATTDIRFCGWPVQ